MCIFFVYIIYNIFNLLVKRWEDRWATKAYGINKNQRLMKKCQEETRNCDVKGRNRERKTKDQWSVTSNLCYESTYYQCYIKICFQEKFLFFPKNVTAMNPSTALGCYWSFRKWPANTSDCTLALRWQLCSDTYVDETDGLQWILKNQSFLEYPVNAWLITIGLVF